MRKLTRREIVIATASSLGLGFWGYTAISQKLSDEKEYNSHVYRPDLDTTGIQHAREIFLEDFEEYDYDEYMSLYIEALNHASDIEYKPDTRQSDIDKAVRDIEEARRNVVTYHDPEGTIQTSDMSYEELCNQIPDHAGDRYHLEGMVTWVAGSFRQKYWHFTFRWNNSSIPKESCEISVANDVYKSYSRGKYFKGNGLLQGYKNGKPEFLCTRRYELIEL